LLREVNVEHRLKFELIQRFCQTSAMDVSPPPRPGSERLPLPVLMFFPLVAIPDSSPLLYQLNANRRRRTDHLTKMYRQEVPCTHQCYLGARRPHCHSIPSLAEEPELDHFLYSATVCERQTQRVPTERIPWLKAVVSDNIQHFSRTRKSKADVAQWVSQVFPENLGTSFALGLPMVILKLILTGVHHFAN
jgi:hypothetical protein